MLSMTIAPQPRIRKNHLECYARFIETLKVLFIVRVVDLHITNKQIISNRNVTLAILPLYKLYKFTIYCYP